METKELSIIISGHAASGKSSLSFLLMKFLREHHFDVSLELSLDYSSESDFNKKISESFDKKIENIRKTSKITIKEVQTARETIL